MKTFVLALVAWFLGLRYEYTQKDLGLLWNRILCSIYLRYLTWKRKWSLPKGNFFTGGKDPYQEGIIIPEAEWELERPTSEKLVKKKDEIFFCGTRTTGECFAIRVTRTRGRHLSLWIYLRTKNGDQYELHEPSLLDLSGKEGFAAKGLRIECQSPMRQWRIVFNGLMRYLSGDDVSTQHVRVNFLWKASSDLFDIQTNACHDALLDSCVVESLRQTISNCERIYQLIDGYEQRGQLMGTITLTDDKESEMYLWGTRQRFKGSARTEDFTDIFHMFGHTKGAQSFHLACYHRDNGEGTPETVTDMSRFIYGNLQAADGVMDRVTETSPQGLGIPTLQDKASFSLTAGHGTHELKIKSHVPLCHATPSGDDSTKLIYFEFTYDEAPGCALGFLDSKRTDLFDKHILDQNVAFLTECKGKPTSVPLVAKISDDICRHESVAGGKGSSLSLLTAMSNENKEAFKVPSGVIVTTAAYDLFLRYSPTKELEFILEQARGEKSVEEVTRVSERAKKLVESMELPNVLQEQIRDTLSRTFGGNIEGRRFAVRSSCTGEDTAEMSAAGQLDTFLGVRGMDAIHDAVLKCWASQFSPVAIQYKRRYGQLLNLPMAVVIMEMVPSDAAGVLFTCDPRSGNPAVTYITANYGLGESVVSGLVESDTICVHKDIHGKMALDKVVTGSKGSKIVMDDFGGTRTENTIEEDKCCVSEQQALQLTRIGSLVERYFGDSRDIEWAIQGKNIYMLQARPITSLYEDTEFETMHVLDTAHQSEWEFFTKANVGEVMHRGLSPLGSSAFLSLFVPEWMRYVKWYMEGRVLMSPYFNKAFPFSHFNSLIDLCEFFHYFAPEGSDMEHIMLSLFGRRVRDKDLEEAVKMRKYTPLVQRRFVDFKTRYASGIKLQLAWKKYGNFTIPVTGNMSARQLFGIITSGYSDVASVMSYHTNSTMASSLFNHDVISALCVAMQKSDIDDDVYSALGSLISSCHQPVSADVPLALERLAEVIAKDMNPKEFAAMSAEQAREWLTKSQGAASAVFESFLKTHGHRGYNEFDVYQPTWRMEPAILIRNLQVLVLNAGDKNRMKSHVPVLQAINSLNLPLSLFGRLKLAYSVEMSRRSVALRESSKSLLIKTMDAFRVAYNELAKKMLEEGFLPERELLFFVTHNEVDRLLDSRNPTILSRAYKRRSVFSKLYDLEFPEITRGPIHPEAQEEPQLTENTEFLKGFPISKGSVRGTARVVMSLDEASSIQRGDILITYATDIGWTPYFTLISGIVTELGGLLSHGAVVAREYGLPCIVGLHGATKVFKTGDRVHLNASQGVLQRLERNGNIMDK